MNIRSDKGITGVDLTIAVIIIMLFVSLITALYLNIYNSSITTKRRTTANTYMTTIKNEIQKLEYSKIITVAEAQEKGNDELIEALKEVITDNNITFYRKGNVPEDKAYKVEIDIQKYNETAGNEWKEDFVRTVIIKIQYRIGKNDEEISSNVVKSKAGPVEDSLGIQPEVKDGMIPVKYVVTNIETNEGYWQATNVGDTEWFDYSTGNWANVMLSDGIEMDSNGKIIKEGSMFVYIPRYAYRITSLKHSYSTTQGGKVDVVFIDTNNNQLQGEDINIYSPEEGDTIADTAYVVHPAFEFGNEKLKGIWVSKFENSNPNCEKIEGTGTIDYTNLVSQGKNKIQSKPNVTSWRNISLNNAYNVSKNMIENDYSYYGFKDNEGIESHLIKNTEWGAVVYLAESIYREKVQLNSNSNFITGMIDDSTTYDSLYGLNTSITGNIYGVYDMSGGAYDMVAGYLANNYTTEIYGLLDVEKQYKNEYQVGTVDTSIENYKNTNKKFGDAIWETSQNGEMNQAWYGNTSIFPAKEINTFVRGGVNTVIQSGIYSFEGVTGAASNNKTFRTIITVR